MSRQSKIYYALRNLDLIDLLYGYTNREEVNGFPRQGPLLSIKIGDNYEVAHALNRRFFKCHFSSRMIECFDKECIFDDSGGFNYPYVAQDLLGTSVKTNGAGTIRKVLIDTIVDSDKDERGRNKVIYEMVEVNRENLSHFNTKGLKEGLKNYIDNIPKGEEKMSGAARLDVYNSWYLKHFLNTCKKPLLEETKTEVETINACAESITFLLIGAFLRAKILDQGLIPMYAPESSEQVVSDSNCAIQNTADSFDTNIESSTNKNGIGSMKDNMSNHIQGWVSVGREFQIDQLISMLNETERKKVARCLTRIPPVNKRVGLIGREYVVDTIRVMLEERSRRVLLHGEGGIGKTAVMLWICNELKENGKTVAWITCSPDSNFKKDLLAFRSVLQIPNKLDDDTACKQIIKELEIRFGNELYLFIDDFPGNSSNDDLDLLNSFNAHIMITSRVVNNVFPCIELRDLEKISAVQLFCKYYGEYWKGDTESINKETVSKIIQAAYGNTLLIELYAKAAFNIGGTLEDFYQLLESDKESDEFHEVYDAEVETIHDRDQKTITIEKSIMSLYKLSDLSPEQQHIMRLFTIFTPEREIYYKIRKWADLDKNALNKLVKLAWLGKGSSEGGYTIHQIIKDSLIRQMKKQNNELMIENYGSLLNEAINTDLYLPRYLPYKKVQERIVLPEDIEKYLEERTKKMSALKDPSKQEELLEKLATLYNNLAGVYYMQGNYELALDHNEKALKTRKKAYGDEHESIAMTYNNMAGVYKELGEYQQAKYCSEEAIRIAERVLDCEDPMMAIVYNSAAGVYQALEDFKNALDYYEKALCILNKSIQNDREKPLEKLERERLDALSVKNNIASVYKDQGKYDVALNKYFEIHDILEKEFPNMDSEMAIIFGSIASAYLGLKDYDNALEYNKKALEKRKIAIGEDHPDTAKSHINTAGVYKLLGDYKKTLENSDKALKYYDMALDHYNKALAIRKTVFGDEHPYTISTKNSITELNRLMDEYVKHQKDV